MNQEVAEEESDVRPADLVASAGLRHVVGEAHQSVVQHDDGALVKDLHLGGEGGLKGPHMHQVDDHCRKEYELGG